MKLFFDSLSYFVLLIVKRLETFELRRDVLEAFDDDDTMMVIVGPRN